MNKTEKAHAQPFVKWAGGKRQLLGSIRNRMPPSYKNYYEPFVGGGAVLFNLQPNTAIINDINSALINAYNAIKNSPVEVMAAIDLLDDAHLNSDNQKAYYYSVREEFNAFLTADETGVDAAACLIYMNKHCFNGLYRVNAKGLFNVPFNNSKQRSYTKENILAVSDYLAGVEILNGDFEEACKGASAGDFVFFDSPYAPLNPTSFESYTKEGFAKEEHERLAALFKELTNRGCLCMLTNHNTEFINDLYSEFVIDVVQVRRSINADASKRTGTEVIIRNY